MGFSGKVLIFCAVFTISVISYGEQSEGVQIADHIGKTTLGAAKAGITSGMQFAEAAALRAAAKVLYATACKTAQAYFVRCKSPMVDYKMKYTKAWCCKQGVKFMADIKAMKPPPCKAGMIEKEEGCKVTCLKKGAQTPTKTSCVKKKGKDVLCMCQCTPGEPMSQVGLFPSPECVKAVKEGNSKINQAVVKELGGVTSAATGAQLLADAANMELDKSDGTDRGAGGESLDDTSSSVEQVSDAGETLGDSGDIMPEGWGDSTAGAVSASTADGGGGFGGGSGALSFDTGETGSGGSISTSSGSGSDPTGVSLKDIDSMASSGASADQMIAALSSGSGGAASDAGGGGGVFGEGEGSSEEGEGGAEGGQAIGSLGRIASLSDSEENKDGTIGGDFDTSLSRILDGMGEGEEGEEIEDMGNINFKNMTPSEMKQAFKKLIKYNLFKMVRTRYLSKKPKMLKLEHKDEKAKD